MRTNSSNYLFPRGSFSEYMEMIRFSIIMLIIILYWGKLVIIRKYP